MIIQTGKLRDIQALGGCEGERPGTEVQNRCEILAALALPLGKGRKFSAALKCSHLTSTT